MSVTHSGKKPRGERYDEQRNTSGFVDMSETINAPKTHPDQGNTNKTPWPTGGAIPKDIIQPEVPNYSFPPPSVQKNQPRPDRSNAGEYTKLIKEVISESNREYRSDLEKNIELKIENSLKSGFSDMLKEIQKIVKDNRSSEVTALSDRENSIENIGVLTGEDARQLEAMMPRQLQFQRSDINTEDVQRQKPSIRVDKWDIMFDGNTDNLNIEDFIFRVEYLQKHHGCKWNEIMGDFHQLLKAEAKEWYWSILREKDIKRWPDLKEALLQQYRSNRSEYEYMRDFEERRQRPGESLDSYFTAMRKLRSRLRTPLPEHEVIRIMKRNLKVSISQILYPMKIYTVEQLRDECKEIERNYLRREQYPGPVKYSQPRRYNEEIYVEEPENEVVQVEEVYEIVKNKNKDSTLICWNCKVAGHSFMDCPSEQRNLFCYKCGRNGVITPKCPKCSENAKRSVSKTGESRSTQTPESK